MNSFNIMKVGNKPKITLISNFSTIKLYSVKIMTNVKISEIV